MFSKGKYIITVIVVMVFFILDRLIKYALVNGVVSEKYFLISLVKNKGAAFGLDFPDRMRFIFYIILFFIFIILVHYLIKFWQKKKYTEFASCLLIIIGAVSNIIDRFRYGAVIDFIDLKIWPVFNLADMMIVGGAILLVIKIFLCPKYYRQQ